MFRRIVSDISGSLWRMRFVLSKFWSRGRAIGNTSASRLDAGVVPVAARSAATVNRMDSDGCRADAEGELAKLSGPATISGMTDQSVSPLPRVDSPMIVDLFAGPGGLDVAAHWLGVPSIGIEFDEAAVDTREAAGLSSILADVARWRADDFKPEFNVLAGGPPCQTYTVAGNGRGRRALTQVVDLVEKLGRSEWRAVDAALQAIADGPNSDPRTGLVIQPLIWALKALEANRPFEAILLEQVPAVKPVWEAMAVVLEAKGYAVDVGVLKAEQYGVPQSRRRAILVARWGLPKGSVKLPSATHQKYVGTAVDAAPVLDLSVGLPKWISMSEALGWDQPFTVISNYGTGGDPKKRCERRHDRPAFTVTGKVTRNRVRFDSSIPERRFGPVEAGILQSFPEDYPWKGRDVAQQIGNAIPPRLGAHVLNGLLGVGEVLDDEFFAARNSWDGPDAASAQRVKDGIARTEVLGQSITKIVKCPARVESLDDGSVVGHFSRSSEVDAGEPEPGHRSGVEVAVGAAS